MARKAGGGTRERAGVGGLEHELVGLTSSLPDPGARTTTTRTTLLVRFR